MPSGFSIEIEKLRAEGSLYVQNTKIVLGVDGKLLKSRSRPKFCNSIFTFPELTFRDFSLAPHQNIYISVK